MMRVFKALLILVALLALDGALSAAVPIPSIKLGIGQASGPQEVSQSLQILFLLTVLSLAPAILMLTTSFTRIIIVLGFLRQALGTQQIPPNQVLLGLALFLTFFNMNPIFSEINTTALQPYMRGELKQDAALTKALEPMRAFMFRQTRQKDLALFVHLAKMPRPRNQADVPTYVLVPSYVISERTIRCQPSIMTKSRILKGSEMVTGGSIIMPMLISVLATTMSMIRKGM